MPVVSATITTSEYEAIEQEHFVKPKSFRSSAPRGTGSSTVLALLTVT